MLIQTPAMELQFDMLDRSDLCLLMLLLIPAEGRKWEGGQA